MHSFQSDLRDLFPPVNCMYLDKNAFVFFNGNKLKKLTDLKISNKVTSSDYLNIISPSTIISNYY